MADEKTPVDNTEINKDDELIKHQEHIAKLEEDVSNLNDKLLRTLAESENIRKRLQKESEDTAKFAIANFAKHLLSVADNLSRAINAVNKEDREQNQALNSFLHGIEATQKDLLNAFQKVGITKISAIGQIFDPNLHEVLFEVENKELKPGTIAEVYEDGYQINERLLRSAKVSVVKEAQ